MMTTIELRTSITAELDQMSTEMLESVSRYVRRLRRHSRPVRQATAGQAAPLVEAKATEEGFTPRVMRFKRGNPWYASDEEVDRLRHEYLTEKYQ